MELMHGPAAILLVIWLLMLAVIVEAGVANLIQAARMLRGMKDAP
jgi:hypothetical protein